MAKSLPVWGTTLMRPKCPAATSQGQVRAIVAARSRAAAAKLFQVSDSYLKNYGCETGNDIEIATALSKPGIVFLGSLHGPPKEYLEEQK
jgi:hypothetical protein